MEGQPLRVHDEHGMLLSHFSLRLQPSSVTISERRDIKTDRLHSAHAMTPYERFNSRSLYLLELAASLRPESGMGERWTPELTRWMETICGYSIGHQGHALRLFFPENSDNTQRPRPIQTRVVTALLSPFPTFQHCPQLRELPRPMLQKVPIDRRSDWSVNINNAGFEKGSRTWMAYCRTMLATRFSSAAA